MKRRIIKKNELYRFELYDIEDKYIPVLEMCFYHKDSDVYYKEYASDAPTIEAVIANFENHVLEMHDQLGYFAEVKWEAALLEFCRIAREHNLDWWLTGSCSACIRGIEFTPHDVDIMFASRDIEKFRKVFEEYYIEPLQDTGGWVTKDFGVLFLHGRIDLASDPSPEIDKPDPVDCGPTALTQLETVQWNGYTIKVPPIEFMINANRRRGRTERVEMLEKYLREK